MDTKWFYTKGSYGHGKWVNFEELLDGFYIQYECGGSSSWCCWSMWFMDRGAAPTYEVSSVICECVNSLVCEFGWILFFFLLCYPDMCIGYFIFSICDTPPANQWGLFCMRKLLWSLAPTDLAVEDLRWGKRKNKEQEGRIKNDIRKTKQKREWGGNDPKVQLEG